MLGYNVYFYMSFGFFHNIKAPILEDYHCDSSLLNFNRDYSSSLKDYFHANHYNLSFQVFHFFNRQNFKLIRSSHQESSYVLVSRRYHLL